MKTLELKKSVFIFRWGAIRLQVHELSVMYSTNRSGVLSWPFCLQRTFAQVSQTLLSLYWTILIFCSSLFQLKVGSHRKDSCSCCFWRNLGTEDLVRFFFYTALCCTVLATWMATSDLSRTNLLVPFSSFLRLDSWLASRSLTAWS